GTTRPCRPRRRGRAPRRGSPGSLADHLDAAADRVGVGRRVEDDRVVGDDIGRDELVDDVDPALVEPLFVEAADEGLVRLEPVGHPVIMDPPLAPPTPVPPPPPAPP